MKTHDNPPASVSTHFTLIEFQIFMHTLHLHLGPNQVTIYSLNLVKDVSDLMSPSNWLHIFGSNVFRLLVPYVTVLLCLTRILFGLTLIKS